MVIVDDKSDESIEWFEFDATRELVTRYIEVLDVGGIRDIFFFKMF